MSFKEKHGALWSGSLSCDLSVAEIVFEEYKADLDQLYIIYQDNHSGHYFPYSYIKQIDPQWKRPFWASKNEKAIMPTLESAKAYLANFGLD